MPVFGLDPALNPYVKGTVEVKAGGRILIITLRARSRSRFIASPIFFDLSAGILQQTQKLRILHKSRLGFKQTSPSRCPYSLTPSPDPNPRSSRGQGQPCKPKPKTNRKPRPKRGCKAESVAQWIGTCQGPRAKIASYSHALLKLTFIYRAYLIKVHEGFGNDYIVAGPDFKLAFGLSCLVRSILS